MYRSCKSYEGSWVLSCSCASFFKTSRTKYQYDWKFYHGCDDYESCVHTLILSDIKIYHDDSVNDGKKRKEARGRIYIPRVT